MAIAASSSLHRPSLLLHLRLLCTSAAPPSSAPSPPLPPPSPSPTVAVDPAVKRLSRSRRYSEVEALLEEKKKSPEIAQESYLSSIIVSYGYARMIDAATRTFDEMDDLGCSPRTAVSLNALLTSYNHAKKYARVPLLIDELSKKHSIELNAASYAILIKALCELWTPEKAYPLLKEMEKKGMEITTITYTPIIDTLYKKGNPEEAEKVWKEMVDRGCVPDLPAYNVKAMYHAHHKKPEDLLKVIEEMELAGMKPDIITHNLLITCYCKNGKFLDAKRVYKSLKEKKLAPNAATYRNFSFFLCKNGDFGMAFSVCKEGIKKNMVPDIGPAKMLVAGLAKDARTSDAKWLVGVLKEKFPPSLVEALKKIEERLNLNISEEESSVVQAA